MSKDNNSIDEELFEKKEKLISLAEVQGYGDLFDMEQSLSDMKDGINQIDQDGIRERLNSMYEEIEELYEKSINDNS